MLINHYTDHKQHTTQPPTPNKPWCQQSWAYRPTGVEREPDSMLASCITFMPNPKRTHTHHPNSSDLMQAQETHTQPNQPGAHPQKMGSLERR